MWPLGWVCLAPFLWSVAEAKTRLGATLLGLLHGLAFRLVSIYWIVHVMMEHGHLPFLAALGSLLLLSLYLSLYPATLAFLMRRPLSTLGPVGLFAAPLIWVAGELLLTHLLTGFPWNLLGYSQIGFLPVIQIADLTGVYGVSFLLVTVNAAIAFAVLQKPRRTAAYWSPLAAAVILMILALGYGVLKLGDGVETERLFKVAVVQDDMDNNRRRAAHRDYEQYWNLVDYYLGSTADAARNGAQVVVWPEGALLSIDMNPPDGAVENSILDAASREKIWMLIGSNDYFNGYENLYNCAFTIAPDNQGGTAGRYTKVHLTPFGEYVPYTEIFGWVPQVVPEISEFQAGEELNPIPLRDGKVGVAICYEVIFPDLVRRFTDNGATLLATISNDAWFGFSAANDQHFNHAVLRAVENRRYLVRCAATGVSGVISPDGSVQLRTRIYEKCIGYGYAAMSSGKTVYAALGDVFSYFCTALALLSLLRVRYTKSPAAGGRRKTGGAART